MPVKDGSNYILRAVKSTLLAMPSSAELIVIDDGSTDDTSTLLNRITDPRLIVQENHAQAGLANALNQGLAAARGELIARMDSDDICLPWRFFIQQRKMAKLEDLDFLFTTAIAFGRPLRPYWFLPQLPVRMGDRSFKLALASWNPAVHPTLIARKSALVEIGGYRNVAAEDLDLWLRAGIGGYKFGRLALPTVALRLHDRQTTRQVAWQNARKTQSEIGTLRRKLAENLEEAQLHRDLIGTWIRRFESNGLPKILAPWKRRRD